MSAGVCYWITFCLATLSLAASWWPCRHGQLPMKENASLFPAPSVALILVLILILGTVCAVKFTAFYQAHWTGPYPGSIRYGDERELSRYHTVLVLLCLALAANMGWRLAKKRMARPRSCATAGIGAAIAALTAFLLTLPRSGDEGVLLWVFLVPLLFASVVVLLLFSIATMLIGNRSRR